MVVIYWLAVNKERWVSKMGYTHYFYTKTELDAKQFKLFAKDAKKLLANPIVPLVYEYDQADKPPEVTDETVRFNGVGNDGHETFMLSRVTPKGRGDMAFNFCKTAMKPYDVYVTACLLLAKHHFGKDIKISSDGDVSDWQEGKALVKKIFDEDVEIEFD
jgi:hypothetical protein